MTPLQLKKLRRELGEYVEFPTVNMGRPERRQAMGQYVNGLLLDGKRKCIVPMATRMADALHPTCRDCVNAFSAA